MFKSAVITSSVVAILCGAAGKAAASTITCPTTGTFDRQATMSNVIACATTDPNQGTPQAADLTSAFGGIWTNSGTVAGSNGSDGWLTALVTTGSWGSLPVSGTWSIDPALWLTHPRAAITFHLGNGGGSPDWFFFEIASGATSGMFDIQRLSGTGGGLSNVALWADPPSVALIANPEPVTLVELGTGLALLTATLRRRLGRPTLSRTPARRAQPKA